MSYFDHFARAPSTPVGDWITRRTKKRLLAYLQPFLAERGAAILEIGAGMGELAEVFREAGYGNYTAVEPNRTMRVRLAERGIETRDYLVPPIQEADRSLDALLLVDVFEHFDGTAMAQDFVAEAHRVLRPGGLLCIVSPDYLHWGKDFYNCDYSHNNVTSIRRTSQLLVNNGFRILDFAYHSAFFFGRAATGVSCLARTALHFACSNGMDKKLYKLKLTFLRRFVVLGVS